MRALLLVVLTVAACASIWTVGIRIGPASMAVGWIDGLYARKEAAARAISGPKVLIIGGSGAHYGFSGDTVTAATGRPTVNFGVHAGLGAPYLLYRAKLALSPGDTAVLALEPQLYAVTPPSDVLAEYVLHFDLRYLLWTDLATALRLTFGFGPHKVLRVWFERAMSWRSELGRPETVSATGDETLATSRLATAAMRDALLATPPFPAPSDASPKLPPPALHDFLKWARQHSVRVVEAWAPLLSNPAYKTAQHQTFFRVVAQWYRNDGAIGLDDPSVLFLPIDDMFEYFLHANEKGRAAASWVLADVLRNAASASLDVK